MVQVIIVAEEVIHSFLSEQYPDWDTQVPVPDIPSMWNGLGDGTLSDESQIVIISDTHFDNTGTMEQALATLAPAACVIVISYSPANALVIEAKTEEAREEMTLEKGPIYFIDPDQALDEIDAILEKHFSEPGASEPEITAPSAPAAPAPTPVPAAKRPATVTSSPRQQMNDGFVGDVDVSRKGIVLASTSSKGGSGKSTVSLLLATTIAQASKKAFEEGQVDRPLDVVVVDMDVRDGQVGFLIGQTAPTALNIRVSPDWGPQTIKNNLVYDERMGFHALLAPKRGRTADDTGPDFYRTIIRNLKRMFDVVILDTSVNYLDELISTVCLPEADAILFVTNLGIGSVFGMTRWFNEVTADPRDGGMGIPLERIGVVANQSIANVGMDKLKLTEAALGARLLVAIPLDTQAVVAAGNRNRLGDLVFGHPEIGPAYFRLAKKVLPGHSLAPLIEEAVPQAAGKKAPVAAKPEPKRKRGRFGF